MGIIRDFVYKHLLPKDVGEKMVALTKAPICDECSHVILNDGDHESFCSQHPNNVASLKRFSKLIMPVPVDADNEFLQAVISTGHDVLKTLSAALPDIVRLKPGSFYIRQDENGTQCTEQVGTDSTEEGFEREYLIETEGSILWFEYTGIRYGVNVADIEMGPREMYFGSGGANGMGGNIMSGMSNTIVTNGTYASSSSQPYAVIGGGGAGGAAGSVAYGAGSNGMPGAMVSYDPQTGITTTIP